MRCNARELALFVRHGVAAHFNVILLNNFRGMLSSAHVLAMDAKNLLDVVDSIRIRCPEVEEFIRNRAGRANS